MTPFQLTTKVWFSGRNAGSNPLTSLLTLPPYNPVPGLKNHYAPVSQAN